MVCDARECHGLPTDADVLWIHVSNSSLVHLGTIHFDGIAKSQAVLIGHSVSLRAWVGFTSVIVLQHCVSVFIH